MKHNLFTYALLALFSAAIPLSAAAPADNAAEAKRIAAEKKKAEAARRAEAARKAAEARKAAAEARKKAQEESRARMIEFQNLVKEMHQKKIHFDTRIETLMKLLERPEMKNDSGIRYNVYVQILRYTEDVPWTQVKRYNYDTIHRIMPTFTKLILEDPSFSDNQRLQGAVTKLVNYYCDLGNWAEAEKWARVGISYEKLHPNNKADAWLLLARVYRYQFRYEDAMKAALEMCKYNKGRGLNYASNLAYEFGRLDEVLPLWKEHGNEYEELMYFADKRKSAYIARALAFVKDEKNPAKQRYSIVFKYFNNDMEPASREARKAGAGLAAEVKAKDFWALRQLKRPFQLGDYPLTVDVCEFYAGSPVMADYNMQCMYVIALGGIGRKADAAKFAAEYTKNEKLSPVQKTRLLAYEALLTGKDPEAVIKAAKLTRQEEAAIYLSLARQTLSVWNMTPLAEKYAKKYEDYFVKPVIRRMEVKFSETPVQSISDWRKIYPTLDKQYCDIPFKGSMDFLETDVATGDRGVVRAEEGAVLESMMELSAVCDVHGLHLFLRTRDSNARAIENGFARGIGTEMYFAPGRNQPYICLGSNPTKGVTFMFQTTYNNKHAKRPNRLENPLTGFRSEVAFTDTDYVLHMFFAWDLYYNKLPSAGTPWRFDCLNWTKAGAFSWGGSQGIHSATAWGDLCFNLTEKQLNAIRKGIIFRSYRSYKMIRQEPGTSENLFEIWKDNELGDPAFYQKMLAPLEAELDSYAKRVKFDMSDADVAEIYTKALPRWIGLTHEIDELRRKYLSEQITTFGE